MVRFSTFPPAAALVCALVLASACADDARSGTGVASGASGGSDGGAPGGAGGATSGGVAGAGGATGGSAGNGGSAGGGFADPEVITVGDSLLKIEICERDLVRVAYANDQAFFTRPSLMAAPKQCSKPAWQQSEASGVRTFSTDALKVAVDLTSGAVSFLDLADQPILAERGRTLSAAQVQGEATQSVRQEWQPNAGEALYGLGQRQLGLMDIKGYDLELYQYNTNIVVPFLVSSRGYGLLWDNTAFSRFGDLAEPEPLPNTTGLYTSGAPHPGDVAPDGGNVDWQGQVQASASGDYVFHTYSSGSVRLTVNGQVVIDHYRQGWLPSADVARVRLEAGQSYPVRLEWTSDIDVEIINLRWKAPPANPSTSLWSEVGDGIDYYFAYGPEIDRVIAGYRRITGQATLLPRSAFGLWQSRERYQTAQQSLDALAGYRSRGIPIDNIVQDWQYWQEDQWGSHEFDATRFPDPEGWIQDIHDQNAKLMISVWPKFYPGTANFDELNAAGFVYQPNIDDGLVDFVGYPFTFYDAFSAEARAMFWSQMQRELLDKNVDAFWLDATEPDVVEGPHESDAERRSDFQTHMHPTALGTGSRMLNAYPLVNSQAVYEGWRAARPEQRVFILTRCAFAGQQRYAAASWSGDITSTWTALAKQIPAGTSFSISGTPYWTVDSGGFAVPPEFAGGANADEWRELNARWFEYATFLPLLRLHGQAPVREMWQFGGDASPAYQAMLKFDRIRYRLLPYIYSLAGAVTHEAGTMLRPLVMDFRTDSAALDVRDQFMFGKALLVSPVTTYLARSRSVYLPTTPGGWYDFWTGSAESGGQTLDAPAPYDAIPIYVRAGSIVPIGPELTYTDEAPADPITLFVYAGADAAFTLYEDDGETYAYESGGFTRIPIAWNDATRELTIGAREGTFPGSLATRTFNVILVTPSKAVGFSFSPSADQSLSYSGSQVSATLD